MRVAIIAAVAIALGVLVARLPAGPASQPPSASFHMKSSAGHRPVPQRFAYKNVVRQHDMQPTDAGYDPVALLQEEQGALTVNEIFEREPKDPYFAPTLEKRIETALENVFRELAIEDKVRGVDVECKTLSCRTRIELATSDGAKVYEDINGILLGDVQEPGIDDSDPSRTYVTFGNLYRPAMRNEESYRRFVAEGMGPPLEYAKQRLTKARDEARR